MKIYTPIVEQLKLQIRFNLKNRCIELQVSISLFNASLNSMVHSDEISLVKDVYFDCTPFCKLLFAELKCKKLIFGVHFYWEKKTRSCTCHTIQTALTVVLFSIIVELILFVKCFDFSSIRHKYKKGLYRPYSLYEQRKPVLFLWFMSLNYLQHNLKFMLLFFTLLVYFDQNFIKKYVFLYYKIFGHCVSLNVTVMSQLAFATSLKQWCSIIVIYHEIFTLLSDWIFA